MIRRGQLFVLIGFLISSCSILSLDHKPGSPDNTPPEEVMSGSNPSNDGAVTPASATPTSTPTKQMTPSPTPTATRWLVGPGYFEGINPLTGMEEEEVQALFKGPVLVSITNFPTSARPQSGLSQASHVWETSIGEGMTRFIGVYYGGYIEALSHIEDELSPDYDRTYILGPVRSGRVAFQEIKRLYPGGRLLIRFASPEVIEQITGWVLVRALDPNDINSAGMTLEDLEGLELPEVEPEAYAELTFDSQSPSGGVEQSELRIIYNYLNNVGWTYDPPSGRYLRSQDLADGSGELFPTLDRLTGERVGFENVLVLWAQHSFENLQATIIEIDLAYLPDGYGLLFRDGKRYEVRWSTRSGKLRVHDKEGTPIPLKPGRTLFEVVSQFSTWDEQKAVVRFVRPALPTFTPIPSATPKKASTPTPTASSTPTPTNTPE